MPLRWLLACLALLGAVPVANRLAAPWHPAIGLALVLALAPWPGSPA